MKQPDRIELLSKVQVKKAVAIITLPTIISQLVNVVYNLADIFFIGQIGDPDKVAGVALAAPGLLTLTAIGNLFGIGGSSAMSRAMGKGDFELAGKHSAFCFWGSIGAAALLSGLLLAFMEETLGFLGASAYTMAYARTYLLWVLVAGSVPSVVNVTMAHMLRADGKPRIAGWGLSMGSVLNIILDPLLILGLGMDVLGVALATLASNLVVTVFFALYWLRNREELVITLNPRRLSLAREVWKPVMESGVPAAVQTLVVSLYFMFINRQASNYGDLHVASIGIVQKLDMIPSNVTLGLSQGAIPLLGYSYAAGDYRRMEDAAAFALKCALIFSAAFIVICQAFALPIASCFMPESPQTAAMAARFLRIMCLCTPFMAICNIMNSVFQATGQTRQALLVCLFRKVYVGLPALYLLDALLPEIGILIVMTVVDAAASVLVLYLNRRFMTRLKAHMQ